MSEAESSAIVQEFIRDVWNGGDLDALDRLTAEDFALHQLVAREDHDRESFREFQERVLDAMPDFSITIDDLITEGEDTVAFVRMQGTPEKPLQAIQPTGQSFEVPVFHKYRLEDGRVAELWVMADAMGTMRQLGLFPPGPKLMMKMVINKFKSRIPGF